MKKSIIVTGGAGFIGCNFVRYALKNHLGKVIVADKLTYAGSLHNLNEVQENPDYEFICADIANPKAVRKLYQTYQPSAVINFAAESHVDRSIERPSDFVETNIVGVSVLLDNALSYLKENSMLQSEFRFLHVSTDEVYGSLGKTGLFLEDSVYKPNSPYAASKAAADHLVRAYFKTYQLPAIITNCSNNYGPYQFPEKLIPLMILNALEGKPLPVYGDGGNVRDWLYVEDHCEGIALALEKGKLGEKYNIGGNNEKTNLEVVDFLCETLEELKPAQTNEKLRSKKIKSYSELKQFVQDRPGHDRRYAIDATKIKSELGWRPKHNFKTGLKDTVCWYLKNLDWCQKVQKNNYSRERLGLAGKQK